MARLYTGWSLGLLGVLALLHVLGGREATVVLTGAVGPTAALGVAYVVVWLLAVAVAPALLLAAALDALRAALERRKRVP